MYHKYCWSFYFICFCQDVSPGMQRMRNLLRIENLNSDSQPRKCITNYIRWKDKQVRWQETMTQHSTMRGWGLEWTQINFLHNSTFFEKQFKTLLQRYEIIWVCTYVMTSFNSCSRTHHTWTFSGIHNTTLRNSSRRYWHTNLTISKIK